MSTIELRPTTAAPGRVGQGTAVEQSRAVAEVHAAIVVAQQCPRDIDRATRDMKRSCAQKSLAEKAFYRYSRGGSQVSGPSVQLARELARCWGNIQYGVTEMRRDDTFGQSEMQAWAWDVETNARSSTTFIVQHIRDTSNGSKALTDQRDIYENNANNGARRLREMIFAILPGWYAEDAIAACYDTLAAAEDGGTREERIAAVTESFGKLGVTVRQLVNKLGAPQERWTPYDLATLRVIYRSLVRGEATREDEFGPGGTDRVSATEILSQPAGAPAAPTGGNGNATPQAPPAAPETAPATPRLTSGQLGIIQSHAKRLGFEDHEWDEFAAHVAILAGDPDMEALETLTQEHAKRVQDQLGKCKDRPALVALTSNGEITSPDGGDQ